MTWAEVDDRRPCGGASRIYRLLAGGIPDNFCHCREADLKMLLVYLFHDIRYKDLRSQAHV
jgi:hypothetical protein